MSDLFDKYTAITTDVSDPRAVTQNINERHYLWYPGEDIPHQEVIGGVIPRGVVVPILPLPKWEVAGEAAHEAENVPTEMRVRVRRDATGHITDAMYYIPPQPIFRTIMKDYGEWGVTDLTALVNWESQDVRRLEIEKVFFPNGIAETYDEIEEQIKSAQLPSENKKVYQAIAQDMLNSLRVCRKWDTDLVDLTETNIEKSKSHPGYVSTYHDPALRAMKRLNRERRDVALMGVATRQNAIVENLPGLIAGLGQQQQPGLTQEALLEFAKTLVSGMAESTRVAVAEAVKEALTTRTAPPVQNAQQQQKR